MAEISAGGGGPGDNPGKARWLPVGIMFALALIGGAVLAWPQLKTNKEFKLGAYRTSLTVLEQLAHVDPGVQGAMSIAHEWVGDVLYDQGKTRARFLSMAEQQLTKVREAQAAPQRATAPP